MREMSETPLQESKPKKTLPPAMKEKMWEPGQSGNPSGRPKGSGKAMKALEAAVQKKLELQIGHGAKKLLNDNAERITAEIVKIATGPGDRIEVMDKKGNITEVRYVQGQNKVKCLLACFDRIVPSLMVMELKDGDAVKSASDMSDLEIIAMMERMVNLASGAPSEGA